MPKNFSKPNRSGRIGRPKHSKTPKTKDDMKFKISPTARQEREETIQKLIPREKNQVAGRDKEFRKFLIEQYRTYCPEIRCAYREVPEDVMDECVDWINLFKGVNKQTDDCLLVDRRFDLPEGRSWVDQRRSKKIVPLFLSWLDTIVDAAREMRDKKPTLPSDLEQIMVEKLLTTSYHPQSSQSNQTLLVCQQSLHTAQMRKCLQEFDIVVPDSKKHLSKFIHNLRQKVENRRFGLTDDGGGVMDVAPDSSDSEIDQVSLGNDQSALIAQKDREIQTWKLRYQWLEAQCSNLQATLKRYQTNHQRAMFQAWANMDMRVPMVPPTWQDPFAASASPSISTASSEMSYSPPLAPSMDHDPFVPVESFVRDDQVMMESHFGGVPLLPSDVADAFMNMENLGR